MICVWWNFEGLIHFEIVPSGKTIYSELYGEKIQRVHEVMASRYPSLVNRGQVQGFIH